MGNRNLALLTTPFGKVIWDRISQQVDVFLVHLDRTRQVRPTLNIKLAGTKVGDTSRVSLLIDHTFSNRSRFQ